MKFRTGFLSKLLVFTTLFAVAGFVLTFISPFYGWGIHGDLTNKVSALETATKYWQKADSVVLTSTVNTTFEPISLMTLNSGNATSVKLDFNARYKANVATSVVLDLVLSIGGVNVAGTLRSFETQSIGFNYCATSSILTVPVNTVIEVMFKVSSDQVDMYDREVSLVEL